jgi:hypothetical protein
MATAKTTPAQKEQTNVATHTPKQEIDFSKMSVEDMLALSKKLTEEAEKQSVKLFDDTMTLLNDKLKAMGKTKLDAMEGLYELMNAEEKSNFTSKFKSYFGVTSAPKGPRKPRAANGSAAPKTYKDADSTGARPEVGATYKLPSGETWKKASKIGATKKEFVAAIGAGKTWAELKA